MHFFSFEDNQYRTNMTLNKLRGSNTFPRLPIELPDGRFIAIETVRMSMPPSIGSVEVTQDLVQGEYTIAKPFYFQIQAIHLNRSLKYNNNHYCFNRPRKF